MSRHKTRPEDIRNPDRYFKRLMAMEYRKEKKAANRYHTMFASLDELAEAEAEGRKGISELLAVDDDIYAEFVNNKYDSATDWINQINDSRLREALQKLSLYQRNLVFLRFCKIDPAGAAVAGVGAVNGGHRQRDEERRGGVRDHFRDTGFD